MLRIVHQTERLVGNVLLEFRSIFEFNAFTLNFLAPAVFIEALAEENHVRQHSLVVYQIDAVAHTVQVESKDLVHEHFLAVLIIQQIIVSLPLGLVRRRRQLVVVVRLHLALDGHLRSVSSGHLRVICGRSGAALAAHRRLHLRHIRGVDWVRLLAGGSGPVAGHHVGHRSSRHATLWHVVLLVVLLALLTIGHVLSTVDVEAAEPRHRVVLAVAQLLTLVEVASGAHILLLQRLT